MTYFQRRKAEAIKYNGNNADEVITFIKERLPGNASTSNIVATYAAAFDKNTWIVYEDKSIEILSDSYVKEYFTEVTDDTKH